MTIEDMTIGEAREIAGLFSQQATAAKPCPFQVGEAYLIRTVTMAWTGRVSAIVGDFLVLETAAWIADTGRYGEAVDTEHLNEVEAVADPVIVALGAVVDARRWPGALPTETK